MTTRINPTLPNSTRPFRAPLFWVCVFLLPALLIRFVLAWAPVNTGFAFSVPDDAYYYFKIAQNIALGNGVTFDGIAPTNGFHPLWMLLITPLWWLARAQNNQVPVHLALTLGALLDIITMFGIWKLARQITTRTFIAAFVVLCYAWNPYNAAASVNGLETALAACLFVWSIVLWWRLRRMSQPTGRDWFLLGLGWSLLVLARTDYAVILLPCALDVGWRFRAQWKTALPALLGLLVWIPWLIWNWVTFNSLNQVSGNAYPYYLHALWEAKQPGLAETLQHEAQLGFGVVANLAKLSGFDKALVLLVVFIGWYAIQALMNLKQSNAAASEKWLVISGLLLPTIGAFGLLLYHGLVRWMYVPWYFVPSSILLCMWFGILLDRLSARSLAFAVILGLLYLGFQVYSGVQVFREGGMWRSQARTAEQQMPRYLELCKNHSTLGITDSGYAGYYLPCRVVNLDGVVNNKVFAAITQAQFRQYLDSVNIEYISLNEIVRQVVELREGPIPKAAPFAPP